MNLRDAYVTALPIVEDIVFSVLSAAVAVALVAGVFMAPEPTIAFAAQKAGPGDNPRFEVLFGAFTDDTGAPISGATIEVTTPSKDVATVYTAADGTYRIRFKDVGGPYLITVTTIVNGETVTGSFEVDMQPGNTYKVSPTLTSDGGWTWTTALPLY